MGVWHLPNILHCQIIVELLQGTGQVHTTIHYKDYSLVLIVYPTSSLQHGARPERSRKRRTVGLLHTRFDRLRDSRYCVRCERSTLPRTMR